MQKILFRQLVRFSILLVSKFEFIRQFVEQKTATRMHGQVMMAMTTVETAALYMVNDTKRQSCMGKHETDFKFQPAFAALGAAVFALHGGTGGGSQKWRLANA